LLKNLDEDALIIFYTYVYRLFVKKSSTGNEGVSVCNIFLLKSDEVTNFAVFRRNLKN